MKPKRKFQNSSRQNSPRHWEVSRKRIRKGEGREGEDFLLNDVGTLGGF